MNFRMGAALLSLLGLFVSAYLYLYKIGRIGTLACGTGGCETVQASAWSRFVGVEVALIGVIGYAALLIVSLASLQPRLADAPLAGAAAVGARRGRRGLHGVSHLSGALRHPRHLPLVRGLRLDHPRDVRASRCSSFAARRTGRPP